MITYAYIHIFKYSDIHIFIYLYIHITSLDYKMIRLVRSHEIPIEINKNPL